MHSTDKIPWPRHEKQKIEHQLASGFHCRSCRLHLVRGFRPAHIFDVAPVPHPLSISSSCCLACSHSRALPHFLHPLLPFFSTLTNKWSVFLSQICSLSAPGPTGPLTADSSPTGQAISSRPWWADWMPPASRVCQPPSFRPRIDDRRLLCSPLTGRRPRAEPPRLAQPQSTSSRL